MEVIDYKTRNQRGPVEITEEDICCNCDVFLLRHMNSSKRNKVYIMDIGDMVCSKRCHKEHAFSWMQIDKEVSQ